jgi:hypothetical protein
MKLEIAEKARKYTPYTKGRYDVSAGLFPLKLDFKSTDLENYAFQIDQTIAKYLKNKQDCRQDDISKYYQRFNENEDTVKAVNKFIVQHLSESYPQYFKLISSNGINSLACLLTGQTLIFDNNYELNPGTDYLTLYDALSSQVAEDVVICQLNDDTDWLSTLHLCSPSYWCAEDKVGKNFDEVHLPTPGMEKMRKNYRPMLESVIRKGPFYRFIWEINTDTVLNHAMKDGKSLNPLYWEEKKFDPQNPELYLRVERQVIIGFPEHNAFLFTIHTYHNDINELTSEELILLKQSLLSMPPESVSYKRLAENLSGILGYINILVKGEM